MALEENYFHTGHKQISDGQHWIDGGFATPYQQPSFYGDPNSHLTMGLTQHWGKKAGVYICTRIIDESEYTDAYEIPVQIPDRRITLERLQEIQEKEILSSETKLFLNNLYKMLERIQLV